MSTISQIRTSPSNLANAAIDDGRCGKGTKAQPRATCTCAPSTGTPLIERSPQAVVATAAPRAASQTKEQRQGAVAGSLHDFIDALRSKNFAGAVSALF